ncbi:hypothetical protein KL911_005077 [Ogataea haglerorum]|uniref:uncharacterized protein n=1 Tax=Ogataea haglerorum TaxID=1937702 RepID=UPI001C8A1C4E|nr:uncharacterized protein KL911_005077 [Ogataea haglerorum]KAG7692432.1 hypothetical protein KL951_005037 [Ogataea haglerorum]KAG7744901.1 hypothetical protein KL912_005054 [Ogataea haglerorum]KAG7749870.1 hypothetical protein KL911_005077 [Ogataea haglerorum]
MDSSAVTEWGSVGDSEIELLLKEHEKRRNSGLNVDTDNKVQIVSSQPESIDATQQDVKLESASQDWGSMDDSEFISFVNKLSQNYGLHQPVITSQTSTDHATKAEEDESVGGENNEDEPGDVYINEINSLDPEEIDPGSQELEFGDYERYFRHKTLKQQQQDQEYVEFTKKARNLEYPPIFQNCVIYVNGKTNPDVQQLHKLIILHGGKFIHMLGAKGNATHIIAENLTPQKKLEFRNYKVVTPKWIVDSVEAAKLQPWGEYMLIHNDYGQRRLQLRTEPAREQEDVEISQLSQVTEPDDNLHKREDIHMPDHMNCKHPNFLPNFFANSRLHHLSSWKADLKSRFLQRAIGTLQGRRHDSRPADKNVILHVDFDCFFATVSALTCNPPIDINEVPVCVTHGGNTSDIASCNYVARKYGCKNGMWLRSARRLCPNLVCLDYNFDEYERVSNIFYEILLSYDIDSVLPVSVDEALVDISSMSASQHPLEIMKDIKKKVYNATNCSVSCGSGSNVLLAKLALRRAKPNGTFYVEDDHITDFLDIVKFSELPGIGPQICAKLETEMQKTALMVKDVRKIPGDKLASIFGPKTGVTIYNYARGLDDTCIDILKNPEAFQRKSISIDVNWGIRFDRDVEVEKFLSDLAKELSKRLANAKMVGSSVTLKLATRHPDAPIDPPKYLGMGECEFVSKTSRLGHFTREAGILGNELRYLYRMLNVAVKELRGVSISMNRLSFETKKNIHGLDADQRILPLNSTAKDPEATLAAKSLCAESTPKKKANTKEYRIPENEINWEVFNELPIEIQDELRHELGRRHLSITGSLYRSPKKRKKDFFNDFRSPTKRKLVMDKILVDTNYVEAKSRLSFQKIPTTQFQEVLDKLKLWFDCTIRSDGPHEMDLNLFNEFMFSLFEIGEMTKYGSIVRLFEEKLVFSKSHSGYEQWKRITTELRTMFNEVKYDDLEFNF